MAQQNKQQDSQHAQLLSWTFCYSFTERIKLHRRAAADDDKCIFLVWMNTETSSPGMDDSHVNTIAAKDYRGPSQNIARAGEEGV